MLNNEISKEKEKKVLSEKSEKKSTILKKESAKKIKKPRKKNYINNADLLVQLDLSHKTNKMTDELAKMLMMLTQRYAKIPRFSNYTYNEDMQAFALSVICKNWRSFNAEKSQNPFAYFTQVIHNAFFQFDNAERNQRDIRDKIKLSHGESASFSYMDRYGTGNEFDNEVNDGGEVIEYQITDYE